MSSTISLRLAVVVLAIAGLSAAQTFSECPSVAASADFFNVANCSAWTTCATTRCTCNGGTFASGVCTPPATKTATCGTATICEAAFVQCVQTAASSASCLLPLKMALMNVVAGNSYNASTVFDACRAATCQDFNNTVVANCSILYGSICFLGVTPAPNVTANTSAPGTTTARFQGVLTLGGDYSAIIASATATTQFLANVSVDLTNKLNVTCTGTGLTAGSAKVTFTADVDASSTTFAAKVAAAAGDDSWLVNTKTAFKALGGTGTFTLIGIGSATTPAPTPKPNGASAMYLWTAFAAVLLAIFA